MTPTAGQSKVYGTTADPALTFTVGGSGLATGDTIASVFSGALARAAGESVGTYAITIGTLTANSNYSITSFTSGVTFAITARSITVTPTAGQSKVYGTTPDPALTFTVGGSGLATGDTIASVFSGALARAAGESVGTYAITIGTLTANSNYSMTFTTGVTFAITPARLTVTALNGTSQYSDPLQLGYSITGFVNGDTQSSALSGALAISTTATQHSAPGQYPITIAQGTLSAANYSFSGFTTYTITQEDAADAHHLVTESTVKEENWLRRLGNGGSPLRHRSVST